ncbi:hypothetical protein NDU88_001232 [Pleurodeles waltl]|uniref:Uncharacterized protein n=1 Tax=Pleurodeles waltl TaxID=8319 RepID=A0AAV7NCU0_PLEWA|nr:hypothetical protein NDU88_001232 [Pleurodeles waltl]
MRTYAGHERGGASTPDLFSGSETPWPVGRDPGKPSTALRPWHEEKSGPQVASRMTSASKAFTRSGHSKEAFSGLCEERGCAPTGVAAPKRQRSGTA